MVDADALLVFVEVPTGLLAWFSMAAGLALVVGRAARLGEVRARRTSRSRRAGVGG